MIKIPILYYSDTTLIGEPRDVWVSLRYKIKKYEITRKRCRFCGEFGHTNGCVSLWNSYGPLLWTWSCCATCEIWLQKEINDNREVLPWAYLQLMAALVPDVARLVMRLRIEC